MSPAPRQLSRKLPLSPQQLSAFDKARKAQTVPEKKKAVDAIVSASFSDGVSIKTGAAKYVLNRLLNGVSVSRNQTRINLSIALIAFIRTLQSAEPKATEQMMISSILTLYGNNGSFEADYTGGERERAIGTVTACAALVRAYDGKLQPATCKEIISLLRPCTTGKCAKWRLGSSSVQIVNEFLRASDAKAVQNVCGKNLWRWCKDIKHTDDGLCLVLTLLQLNIASQSAVEQIYPDLDSVAKALSSTFKTGFSSCSGYGEGADVVPLPWKLALNYAFSADGQKHLGGVEKFWRRVVGQGLIHFGKSMEKKALALGLVHLAVPYIGDESSFAMVFDSSLSHLLGNHSLRRSPPTNVEVTKDINSAATLRHVHHSVSLLGEAVINKAIDASSKETPSSLLQWFVLWAVRNQNMAHVMSLTKLDSMLGRVEAEEIRSLFCVMVNEFAFPKNQTSQSGVRATRIQTFEFVLKLANRLPSLLNDIVRIFFFYAVVDDSCYQSPMVSKEEQLKLDSYKAPSNVSLVCNSFPALSAPLSLETAHAVFAKLIRFISKGHNKGHQATWISFGYNHLKLILSWKWIKPRTQHDLEDEDQGEGKASETQNILERLVEPVLLNLSEAHRNVQKGFVDAIQLLSKFAGLALLTPFRDSNKQVIDRLRMFCVFATRELFQISSLLKKDDMGVASNRGVENGETERQPDAIERLTKLLCEICKRSGAIPHHMTLTVIAEMGSSLDDRVVAVLFDAMEEVLQTDRNQADAQEHDDSDESEEEGEDPTTFEENDSDEFNSDMQVDEGGREGTQRDVPFLDQNQESADDNLVEAASGEEGSSDSDIDMDVDDEDPAVLEELDKRLVTHMKLVLQEKNASIRGKREPEAKFQITRRILNVIEEVAKNLRLRLSTNKDDGRTGIVFLDLQCRLYEFAMSETRPEGQFLKNVCGIISKHMLLPLSLLQEKVADKETACHIADRFLSSLSTCDILKPLSDLEIQTISKSAACIVGVAALSSDNDYEQFMARYQNLMKVMLTTNSIMKPKMFSSFLNKAPSLSLSLFPTVCESLETAQRTRNQIGMASIIILQLAELTEEQNSIPIGKRKAFWVSFSQFLQRECEAEFKGWALGGIENIIRVVHFGCTRHFMVVSDSHKETLLAVVKAKVPQKRQHRFRKLLDSASTKVKLIEVTEKDSLCNDDEDQAKKVVSKKRKLK